MSRIPIRTRSARVPVAWALSIVAGACAPALAQAPPQAQPAPEPREGTIQVSGQATIQVPADRALISFAVETEAATAQEASASNAERMDAVIRALRNAGVRGLEVETFGYSLNPEYQSSREGTGGRTIVRYRAMNHVRVRLPGVENAGRVLDTALEAGANRVADLTFEASDTREARLQALRDAVAKAREEAETIAQAMGVSLGRALEVQGGASAPPPRPMDAMQMRAIEMAVSTPIEAGTQTVSASVSITYRIREPGR